MKVKVERKIRKFNYFNTWYIICHPLILWQFELLSLDQKTMTVQEYPDGFENHTSDNICDLCGKRCSSTSNLNTHMLKKHWRNFSAPCVERGMQGDVIYEIIQKVTMVCNQRVFSSVVFVRYVLKHKRGSKAMKRFTQKNHSDADSVTIELKESTH